MSSNDLNNLFKTKTPNPFERAFAMMLTEYIIFDILPEVSPTLWQDAEIEVRVRDKRIPLGSDDTETNRGLALAHYSTRYVAEKLDKTEILSILSDALKNSQEKALPVFEAFGRRFGEPHIYYVFFAQHKKKIKEYDRKTFLDLFKYPCWLEFSKNAKEQIHAAILKGQLSDQEIDYYLGVSEKHEDYAELFPVVKYIIKNTNDAHLLWTAGDVLNLIWLNLPDDEKLQKMFRKEIYDMFWPRIGSSWPIINHDDVHIEDKNASQIFEDSYGWLTSLSDLGELNPDLKDVPTRTFDNGKRLSLKRFLIELEKTDGFLALDDDRIKELLDNFNEVVEISAERGAINEGLLQYYKRLCQDVASLKNTNGLEQFGKQIKTVLAKANPQEAKHYEEIIDELTVHAKRSLSEYQQEQDALKNKLMEEFKNSRDATM